VNITKILNFGIDTKYLNFNHLVLLFFNRKLIGARSLIIYYSNSRPLTFLGKIKKKFQDLDFANEGFFMLKLEIKI